MSEIYIVRPGDYMETIAEHFGFRDFHLIYDHPNNQSLKALRPNPHILYPGDKVFIPDKVPGDEAVETDKKHKFVLKTQKVKLILYIRRDGKAYRDHKYTLKVGASNINGKTGSDGLIKTEVPVGAVLAELTFAGPPTYTRKLNLGFLHPITTVSGVQMRLNNLGFGCGPATGAQSSLYKSALQSFQKKHLLSNQSGTLDNDTINALRSEYEQGVPS